MKYGGAGHGRTVPHPSPAGRVPLRSRRRLPLRSSAAHGPLVNHKNALLGRLRPTTAKTKTQTFVRCFPQWWSRTDAWSGARADSPRPRSWWLMAYGGSFNCSLAGLVAGVEESTPLTGLFCWGSSLSSRARRAPAKVSKVSNKLFMARARGRILYSSPFSAADDITERHSSLARHARCLVPAGGCGRSMLQPKFAQVLFAG